MFTYLDFGGTYGNNHNFHSDIETPPEKKIELLDGLYNCAWEHLKIITSQDFDETYKVLRDNTERELKIAAQLLFK